MIFAKRLRMLRDERKWSGKSGKSVENNFEK